MSSVVIKTFDYNTKKPMEGIITTISFHGEHVTGAYSTINVPERHDNSWL